MDASSRLCHKYGLDKTAALTLGQQKTRFVSVKRLTRCTAREKLRRSRSECASALSARDLLCPQIYPTVPIDSVSWQRRIWLDCLFLIRLLFSRCAVFTVSILNIWKHLLPTILVLKFEQDYFISVVASRTAGWMTNSVDPDQTPRFAYTLCSGQSVTSIVFFLNILNTLTPYHTCHKMGPILFYYPLMSKKSLMNAKTV